MANRLPSEDCYDSISEEEESFTSSFSPPFAVQAQGPHGGELVVDVVNLLPATTTANGSHESLGLLPPSSMPPGVQHFQVNIEIDISAIQLLQVPGMEDNAMPQQETIEGYNAPAALIVGHPLQHPLLLPGQVHNQANAPNIPQQESQEGHNGPAAFVVGHQIHPLHPLQQPPLLQANIQANALDPEQESLVGQQGPLEMVVGRLLPIPQELLQRWLNHHNIRRAHLVGRQFLEINHRDVQDQQRRGNHPIVRQLQPRPQQADYDGSCILRMGNIRMLREKARQGIGVCLTSNPFYLKGYRMCVQVYLNGDGVGRGTHLSVFFVLMHGEYDTLLQSPFRQQVTIALQDQSGHGRHIAHTLRPLPTPQQLPTEMNVASGAPQFAPLSVLSDDSYVSDDTLFLRVRLHR